MSIYKITSILAALTIIGVTSGSASAVTVYGNDNPWLAGMPNGSTASYGDAAPTYSPTRAARVVPGQRLTFNVSGWVSYVGESSGPSPDGGGNIFHYPGAENGISNITAPVDSLVGVFLGATRPDTTAAPVTRLFDTAARRNFSTLSPRLKQFFFIGDGRTSNNALQTFIAPAGSTRLFLGSLDGYGWYNNSGSFNVTLGTPANLATAAISPAPVPLPPTALLLVVAGCSLIAVSRTKRQAIAR